MASNQRSNQRTLAVLAPLCLLTACVSLRPYDEVLATLPPRELLRLELPSGELTAYVRQWGSAGAEPVVLLHGFGASSDSWRLVAPRLAGRLHLVAPDLAGFGYTERSADSASYTTEGQTRLVFAAMDRLGMSSAHLVGHSYGGGVAAWIASHHPERVRSLVLIDSASPDYAEERRSPAAWITPLVSYAVRGRYLKDGYVRRSLERNFFDDSLVTDEMVHEYAERLRVEGVVGAYQRMTVPRPRGERPPSFDFSAVRQPTLVIWGDSDDLIPLQEARVSLDRLPDARLVVIPDCGHIPMEEKPEETAAAMLGFLPTTG